MSKRLQEETRRVMRSNPISLCETQERSVLKPLLEPQQAEVCQQVTSRPGAAVAWLAH